jgi:hypothetical protein
VAFGNLASRPDLRPLFGALSAGQNDALLDRLLAIDATLTRLAEQASSHVDVPYQACGLKLVMSIDGTCAGVHGGPSGDAGDIWFDISFADVDRVTAQPPALPWVVTSVLVVFCCDSPEPRGESNTHYLVRLEEAADTSEAVLDILESHVSRMSAELEGRPPESFTKTPHDQLP